jgi:endonuclease-3
MSREPARDTRLPRLRDRVPFLLDALAREYPETRTALHHANPLQLLVATVLSAQCTDRRVNMVTPALFTRFKTAEDFAAAGLSEIQRYIKSTGFFRAKARNIRALCRVLVKDHGGQVPGTLEELVKLPGVGRKTANVVLGDGFGVPGITVDTHVGRLSRRLGLTLHTDPVKVERDLMRLVPRAEWTRFSHRLIFHGRQVCHARKPRCEACTLAGLCPKKGVSSSRFPSSRPGQSPRRGKSE